MDPNPTRPPQQCTIALTGATGFVGRHTLARLLESKARVKALVRPGRQLASADGLSCISGSLERTDSLSDLVRGCDAVIHIAGSISGRNYVELAKTNASGCHRLITAIRKQAPDARLVHVSSLAAREPALSDYAASKRAGEDLVTTSDLDWWIVRPPAVYGQDDPALAPLWRFLARGLLPRIGPPQARFSLLQVTDLAAALVDLAMADESPHTDGARRLFCLHDGRQNGYSWNDIAKIASQRRKGAVRTIPVPPALLRTVGALNMFGARLSGKTPPALVPGKVAELVHPDWVCDNTELPGCPEWKPLNMLEDCLTDLPGWSRYQ